MQEPCVIDNATQAIGRPSEYNPIIANKICDLVATHTYGINKLIRMYGLPDDMTISRWRFEHDDFDGQYARAKQRQAQLIAEQLVDMCDIAVNVNEHGHDTVDSGVVALLRVKVDAIKWQASKLVPKLYGDKVQTEVTIVVKHEDALGALE